MIPMPTIGKLGRSRLRQSPDSAWPLRDRNGLTWAERKKIQQEKGIKNA